MSCFRAFRGAERLHHEGEFYRLSLLPSEWSPPDHGAGDPPVDIGIADGRIAALEPGLSADGPEQDLAGRVFSWKRPSADIRQLSPGTGNSTSGCYSCWGTASTVITKTRQPSLQQ